MRVALVNPRGAERYVYSDMLGHVERLLHRDVGFLFEDFERIPNLALLTLAAYFPDGDELHYVDEDYIPPDESQERLFGRRYDLAVLSALNTQAQRAYAIAAEYRLRGTYTVMGGLHASALPDEAAQFVDTVVVGEGEEVFPQFLADLRGGSPRARYVAPGDVDLTKVPPPRYDLLEDVNEYDHMLVQATRGCPRSCSFCCLKTVYGSRFRHKEVSQVVDEVRRIKALKEKPFIVFADENMLCDREFSLALAGALEKERVPWACFTDIAVADDDEIIAALVRAHCVEVFIGLESVAVENLERECPWKARSHGGYARAVRKIQSMGLGVMGLFILGFDGDDPSIFERVREFIAEAELFNVDFGVLCPVPGSAMHARLRDEGRLLTTDWSRYTWIHVNYRPKGMTPRELMEGCLWLFREVSGREFTAQRDSYYREKIRAAREAFRRSL